MIKKQLFDSDMVAEGGAEYIGNELIELSKSIALNVADIVQKNYVIDWTSNLSKSADIERAIFTMLTMKYHKQIKLEDRKRMVQPLLQLAKKHYAVLQ